MRSINIITAAAVLIAIPALAGPRIPSGALCIDCAIKHPSHKVPSVNDLLKDVHENAEVKHNAAADVTDASTAAKRDAETSRMHAEANKMRAAGEAQQSAAEANRSNAAAGYLDRAGRPRPFQSGY